MEVMLREVQDAMGNVNTVFVDVTGGRYVRNTKAVKPMDGTHEK